MIQIFNPKYQEHQVAILQCIENFHSSGKMLSPGKRNTIKIFEIENLQLNIKSFKKPNFFNSFVYKYIRPSKAKRSFEFATILEKKGIGTPEPIAYFEATNFLGLKESYYVCKHLNCDFLFRDLVVNDYVFPDVENILKQFAKFTFNMHENGIEFKDHSPGNTLITKINEFQYEFALVDLNRMNFHENMNFNLRMKNLCRIVAVEAVVKIIAKEYALLYHQPESAIFNKLWSYTSEFQRKFWRKKRLKQKIKLK